jgi:hypothetical protein
MEIKIKKIQGKKEITLKEMQEAINQLKERVDELEGKGE